MNDDDRKRKREKNNESVRKCRQNEKLKIESAKKELEKYKQEYQELAEKYESLQKELRTLRSLFQSSNSMPTTATNSTSLDIKPDISTEPQCQLTVNKQISNIKILKFHRLKFKASY